MSPSNTSVSVKNGRRTVLFYSHLILQKEMWLFLGWQIVSEPFKLLFIITFQGIVSILLGAVKPPRCLNFITHEVWPRFAQQLTGEGFHTCELISHWREDCLTSIAAENNLQFKKCTWPILHVKVNLPVMNVLTHIATQECRCQTSLHTTDYTQQCFLNSFFLLLQMPTLLHISPSPNLRMAPQTGNKQFVYFKELWLHSVTDVD